MKTTNGFKFASEKKTIGEQIRDIKKSRTTREEKIIALRACGLLDREIQLVLNTYVPKAKTIQFTFGVEIECINATREDLIRNANENGIEVRSEDYNHTDNKKYYKIVYDGSLVGDNSNEVVSPILSQRGGFKSLNGICKTLNESGATTNRSCGLHVHIGAEGLSEQGYVNVFYNYQKLEKVIDTFMAKSRRENNNRFTLSLVGFDFVSQRTRTDVCREMNNSRYYKVNPCSYMRHKTIEFRQHQGSVNYKKIAMWVKFCEKLVAYSATNKIGEVNNIDEIPFLNKTEKTFFKNRTAEFARRENV